MLIIQTVLDFVNSEPELGHLQCRILSCSLWNKKDRDEQISFGYYKNSRRKDFCLNLFS